MAGSDLCYLSVLFGNRRWEYFAVAADENFQAELIAREAEFWGYVERDEPPPRSP